MSGPTIHIELKQHLGGNQNLRNSGASNEDIQTAAMTYIAGSLGNLDEAVVRIEGHLADISEHLNNIEMNTRGTD